MERALRGWTRVAWAQYEATAPEIPQLSHPSMEPELAIVVVETGKAPGARKLKLPICVVRVFRIGTGSHSQHVDSQCKFQVRNVRMNLIQEEA